MEAANTIDHRRTNVFDELATTLVAFLRLEVMVSRNTHKHVQTNCKCVSVNEPQSTWISFTAASLASLPSVSVLPGLPASIALP